MLLMVYGRTQLVRIVTFLLLLFILSGTAGAHPGRTDSVGCHTCRTNCPNWGLSAGEYHCHNSKGAPQPEEPIKSTFGQGGTGYTQPAPEYKAPKAAPAPTEQKPVATTEAKKEEVKVEVPTTTESAPVPKIGFWQRFFGWLFGN